jgi:predicted Zn-dependent protease with MMP-like domain
MNQSALTAPTLDDLEAIAREAFARLPENFRNICEGILFSVAEFPTAEVLSDLGLDSEFDLLGLFQGPNLADREARVSPEPTMIFLYRRPILDYWAENAIPLGDVVRHVLVHEIGHHFGLTDGDMDGIENAS